MPNYKMKKSDPNMPGGMAMKKSAKKAKKAKKKGK